LRTGIDLDGVVDDVDGELADMVSSSFKPTHRTEALQAMPINVSEDAGHFLCDFIYYTSLHEAAKRWGPDGLKRVLFVHVPPDGTLEEGIKVLTAIIRAVVRRSR
jgi:pyroglutamyl-peptidase